MKRAKSLAFAVLLASTISVSTFAGDIETPGYAPPPPPRMSADESTSGNDTDSQQTGETTAETSDYLLYEALAALLSVY